MSRRIKIYINTGFAAGKHVDYDDLPEGWDDWTEEEREDHLNEVAQDFMSNRIDYGAYVVDEEDDE